MKQHEFGQGRVLWGMSPEDALKADGVPADFASGHQLNHIHRQIADWDVYFVANPHPYELTATCSFRVHRQVARVLVARVGTHGTCGRVPGRQASDSRRRAAVSHRIGVCRLPQSARVTADPVVEVQRDGKLLVSATPVPPIAVTVTKARYGVLDDPQRTRDVTAKVQRKMDDGKYSFPVSSLAEGDDPAEGTVKTLIVEYSIEGKTVHGEGH